MKISEYIEALQSIMNEHGDLEVEAITVNFDREEARSPVVGFRKVLKGRESKPSFFHQFDSEDRRGEKVVRV